MTVDQDDEEIIAGINVTPLVDVVLVLLVIFLITAPAIYQSALKVQLPQSKAAEGNNEKSSFKFTLTQSGELFLENEKLDWQNLTQKVKSLSSDLSDKTAIISADRKTPHGDVVRLMDQLKQAGLNRFGINVETATAP